MKKRLLCALLAVLLCLSLLPAALAADGEPADDPAENEVSNTVIASGNCGAKGDNLKWKITDDGVLTIYGTGEMKAYQWGKAPWYKYRNKVTKLVLKSGMTNIADGVFWDMPTLGNVKIPATVKSVNGFWGAGAKSITLPEGVETIEAGAFGCTHFKSITIPASVKIFGREAFWSSRLENIYVAKGSKYFCSVDGVLYSKDKKTLVLCPPHHTEKLTILSGVKTIKDCACGGWTTLKTVKIPGSVTTIESNAFACNNYLKSITIPAKVKTIGDGAFRMNEGMTAFKVDKNNPYYRSVDGVLYTKNKKTLVAVPGGKTGTLQIPNGVQTISGLALNGVGAKSVIIPASVTQIGWAINGGNLKTVYFNGNAPVGNWIQFIMYEGQKVTVYYPKGNTTWTSGVRTRFSKDVTWKTFKSDETPAPAIMTQPKAATAAAGTKVTFKVKAGGVGTIKYQWYVMKTGASSWAKLSGKTGTSLSLTAKKSMNGFKYRCVVSNKGGSVKSNAVKLTVK